MNRWQLPEAISDLLPPQAQALETIRRSMLDLFRGCGYELVAPPLVEYLESLLIASGGDLDLKTFKLIDQLSGRTLGVRADITPQVARLDEHRMHGRQGTRLCYSGPVLRTRPNGLESSREPVQIGAEIYGYPGVEADIEVLDLMVRSFALADVGRLRVDLCDLRLARLLLADLPELSEEDVFAFLQVRDLPALAERVGNVTGPRARAAAQALVALADCVGPVVPALVRARAVFAPWPEAAVILDQLERVATSPRLLQHAGTVEFALDLADVRGFRYHTGLSFGAYSAGHARAVGRGGRYDGVGAVFGRSRAATGFSLDLRELVEWREPGPAVPVITAPWSEDPMLGRLIDDLRRQGHVVLQLLPGQTDLGPDLMVAGTIAYQDGHWLVPRQES